MGHESIIYGFIEGSMVRGPDNRRYQKLNLEVIQSLPDHDEYPFLARGMFSAPQMEPTQGVYRSHVIHFGGSLKGNQLEELSPWILKFENLLRRLYWERATVHVLTELEGSFRFQWSIHGDILHTYLAQAPMPTTKWNRRDDHSSDPSGAG
jgi:hypothetical protein